MSTPIVPARPTRANVTTGPTDAMPHVPPRPLRKTDPSPNRNDFRSPLNELPDPMGRLSKRISHSNLHPSDLPPRPPSVSFPSVGQEGEEYASLTPESSLTTPKQTINVDKDMPLHAPKASVPQSTATSRISTVTSTDSTQAAAMGIGRAKPADDVHKAPASGRSLTPDTKGDELKRIVTEPAPLRQKPSFTRSTSATPHGSSRPASMYEEEHHHGIPEIGRQIPLYPNAGDVQAPSPGPGMSQHTPGIGFFNDGSNRAHQRRRSGVRDFNPPGSYGLHSHGIEPHDQFERDWYAKHPDKALVEGHHAYGRPRPESALSSAELNRIVTQTDNTSMGPAPIGTPGEEVGYHASEAYAARISPKPSAPPTQQRTKRGSSGSEAAMPSPLRRTSFPWKGHEQAVASGDNGVIHVDAPEYAYNKVTGGGPQDDAVDFGPNAGNTPAAGGWFEERGTGTPILASDEISKRHESLYMQPAVNLEYHHDEYDSDHAYDRPHSRSSSARVPSRPSSRPGSVHGDYLGGNLHRWASHEDPHHVSAMHTPLEEIEEYEPLIPEGADNVPIRRQKTNEAKKLRPGLELHHFPSQDIWEDTPSSLQFSTTVSTPDITEEKPATSSTGSALFETPQEEESRKTKSSTGMTSDEKTLLKPHYASRVVGDRPGVQRFPSKDIWEDTPSSLQYSTTVGSPQMDDTRSTPDDRPTTTAIPGSQDDADARASTGFSQLIRPSIPTRPKHRSKLAEEVKPRDVVDNEDEGAAASPEASEDQPSSPEKTKAPPIPDRPKPTIPARPARTSRGEHTDASGAELTKSSSAEAAAAAEAPIPVTKTKPVVPTRPGTEKIAALKAGFMNDLNNRLKIGPQPAKKEVEPEGADEEAEKAPLADARKSRAKGPARRKPAAAAVDSDSRAAAAFSFSTTRHMWSIDENDELQAAAESDEPLEPAANKLEQVLTTNEAVNTEEPPLAEPPAADEAPEVPKLRKPSVTLAEGARVALEQSSASPEDKKSMAAKLEAELAEVGAGPAITSPEATAGEVELAPVAEGKSATELTSADKAVEEGSAVGAVGGGNLAGGEAVE